MLDVLHTRIRDAREKAGLTQEEMADRIGIGRTTYINFENGQTNLFSKNLHKMVAVLGVSEEELLFGPRPDQGLLDEISGWEVRKQQFIDDYENRLAELREQLEAARREIAKRDKTIATLCDINKHLLDETSKQR